MEPQDDVAEEIAKIAKGDYLPGVVRTAVPTLVGYVGGWIADAGLDVDAGWTRAGVTATVGIGYYALMRLWELRGKRWATRLLGSRSTATFTKE